jgi:hypothetical protein
VTLRLSLFLVLALAGCASAPSPAKKAADEGYLLGASDSVKQLYWMKQSLEAPRGPAGKTEYYTWEQSGRASDGRKLVPETVSVPVFVPAPAPAAAPPP